MCKKIIVFLLFFTLLLSIVPGMFVYAANSPIAKLRGIQILLWTINWERIPLRWFIMEESTFICQAMSMNTI